MLAIFSILINTCNCDYYPYPTTSLGESIPWNSSGNFQNGKSTHYGPYPSFPAYSEPGFQEKDVGVGCSNGEIGGDPNWNKILQRGTRVNPLLNATIWPLTPTVAVSEAAWPKKSICWKSLRIRNRNDHSLFIDAIVVDFCPKNGCLWAKNSREYNVDIYGEESWKALGGGLTQGVLDVEIMWPEGLVPYQSSSVQSTWSILCIATLFWFNL